MIVAWSGRSHAQQSPGRAFNPLASALLPDVIAFEQLDRDRRELLFMRASSGEVFPARQRATTASGGGVVLPDLGSDRRDLTSFSGDLDWRPKLDGRRLWFAYVESDGAGLRLLLNFIESNGRLATSDPIRVPFEGNVRAPRWSPDGKHLVFVSGARLYLIPDADQALAPGRASRLTPVGLRQPSGPVYFPEWSPDGSHIAYQVETTTRGVQNMAIEVLPIWFTDGGDVGTPVIVTESLREENEYRPSWSPDGRHLSFYVDRLVARGTESPILDVGIVEVQLNPTDRRVFRGEVREGRSRRLAERVIPNESRGPAWTEVQDGASASPAIVYVQRDEARNNPVLVAGLQRWLDQRPREQFEIALSGSWGTVNHKFVRSTRLGRGMRYVFVSVEGGGERVHFRDEGAGGRGGRGGDPELSDERTSAVPARFAELPHVTRCCGTVGRQATRAGVGRP
jgi:dipeptidyl aminopeptidase/acylaminoacyl peptidase